MAEPPRRNQSDSRNQSRTEAVVSCYLSDRCLATQANLDSSGQPSVAAVQRLVFSPGNLFSAPRRRLFSVANPPWRNLIDPRDQSPTEAAISCHLCSPHLGMESGRVSCNKNTVAASRCDIIISRIMFCNSSLRRRSMFAVNRQRALRELLVGFHRRRPACLSSHLRTCVAITGHWRWYRPRPAT